MRTCKLRESINARNRSNVSSDGATPEQKAQQILSIAPILKGQPASSQPQASHPRSNAPPQHVQQQSQPPAQQQPAGQSDLIDFGQHNSNVPTSASAGQPPSQQPMQQPGNPSSSGLQAPLEPGHPLHRVDTMTKDVDEFVDAQP